MASDAADCTVSIPVHKNDASHKSTFCVPQKFEFIKYLGSGAFGVVASFRDCKTGKKRAVKKIENFFSNFSDGKRGVREVKLLQHLKHPNILSFVDLLPPEGPNFNDIYIVTELMDMDLARVIYSKFNHSLDHCQYYTHQLLLGLEYIHSINIVHRDLKPANLFVNTNNSALKIGDFGLARVLGSNNDDTVEVMTHYVVTRWYRAPEVVLKVGRYSQATDMWSVGCILAELINRKALFKGQDRKDQIRKIVEILGMPSALDLECIVGMPRAMWDRWIKNMSIGGRGKRVDWSELFPAANGTLRELLCSLLTFNPATRISASEALSRPWIYDKPTQFLLQELAKLNDGHKAAFCDLSSLDWSFDKYEPTKLLLQDYMYAECAHIHPEIRDRDYEQIQKREHLSQLLAAQRPKQVGATDLKRSWVPLASPASTECGISPEGYAASFCDGHSVADGCVNSDLEVVATKVVNYCNKEVARRACDVDATSAFDGDVCDIV